VSTITGVLMQRDPSYANPLGIPHDQEATTTTTRRAPYYYREMVEHSNNNTAVEPEEAESNYYAVCDIFNPNPYHDRRF